MLEEQKLRKGLVTLGADKGYDTADFVADCREIGVVPHVAQNCCWSSRNAEFRT
jgi:hypothetical protein